MLTFDLTCVQDSSPGSDEAAELRAELARITSSHQAETTVFKERMAELEADSERLRAAANDRSKVSQNSVI